MKIKLLYGDEFWPQLDELISNAKDRVFLASAYWGENDYKQIIKKINNGIFCYFAARDDSSFIPPNRCLKIDKNTFHGKIYLIDNHVIIGSQNLYKAKVERQGEYSVLFETDKFTSSLILYQALLKLAQQCLTPIEPVDSEFMNYYDDGCPFCGNISLPDPLSIYKCPEYGGGFVSDEDCFSYLNTGACKYCIKENRESIGECYCCDQSGCGFGISLSNLKFIYHTLESPDKIKEQRAKEFIRLFNFISSKMSSNDLWEFINVMEFKGNIYNVQLERTQWQIQE